MPKYGPGSPELEEAIDLVSDLIPGVEEFGGADTRGGAPKGKGHRPVIKSALPEKAPTNPRQRKIWEQRKRMQREAERAAAQAAWDAEQAIAAGDETRLQPGEEGFPAAEAFHQYGAGAEGEATIYQALIDQGETPEAALHAIKQQKLDPHTLAREYLAVSAERKAAKDRPPEDLSPSERMKLRATELNKLHEETKTADAHYANVKEKFDVEKSKLEQGFHTNRMDIMANKQALLLADAEDADEHVKKVIKLNNAYEEKSKLYEEGTSALFERGLGKLGLSFDETGKMVKGDPTDKAWGIGPPGFTSADGSFSALRTAHSLFWILGATANTAASVVSAMAGKKMSTIPNYLTDALFKAMDYDAKKGAEEMTSISRLATQGTNAWSRLQSSFSSRLENENALAMATTKQVSKYIATLESNPDYAPMMKNPNFLGQIEGLKQKLGIHEAELRSRHKNATLKLEGSKRESDLRVIDREFTARRDESNARLNQLRILQVGRDAGKVKDFTDAESAVFTTFVNSHNALMRGLELLKLVEETQNLDPGDLAGLDDILLANTNLAGTFGGGETALLQEVHKIGRLTGRRIMRQFEKGQTTDKDAKFGEDLTWMATHSVGYIRAVMKDRLNILVSGVLAKRTLMDESFHKRIDDTLLMAGIADPDEMIQMLSDSENGLTAGRLKGFGYNNGGIRKAQRRDIQENFNW